MLGSRDQRANGEITLKEVQYTLEQVKNAEGQLVQPWWYRTVIRPIATRLTWLVVNYTKLTPNQITLLAFLMSVMAAICFVKATHELLILGAIFFELHYTLDYVDGKVARLLGRTSVTGKCLDEVLDRWRSFIVVFGLSYGQYRITGDAIYLGLGFVNCFLVLFSYWFLVFKRQIRESLERPKQRVVAPAQPSGSRIARFFASRRMLPHPAGDEFELLASVIGPVTGLVKEFLFISSACFLGFCLLSSWKFFAEVRQAERHRQTADTALEE